MSKLFENSLKILEEKSPKYDLNSKNIGIITAADSNVFLGLQMLYTSIKGKIPFTCFDIGLTKEQIKWCVSNNMQLSDYKEEVTNYKGIKGWQTILKPFYMYMSPYEYTIWVDTDCIIVGDLSKSDLIQNKRAFFTKHWLKSPISNSQELYKLYPADSPDININAGVFAFTNKTNKESDILDRYIWMINEMIDTPYVRQLVSAYDEGALVWAIQKTGKLNLITSDSRYNCFCKVTSFVPDTSKYIINPLYIDLNISPTLFFNSLPYNEQYILHFSSLLNNNTKHWVKWT